MYHNVQIHIFLKTVIINNKQNKKKTLKRIKNVFYSMKKNFAKEKNLEFLAYGVGNYLSNKLVEEFQLFTKVIKYNDLVIKVSDIDGNLIIN